MKSSDGTIQATLASWGEMVKDSPDASFSAHETPYGTKILTVTLGKHREPGGFCEWWKLYPPHNRKRGKAKCLRKWLSQGLERDAELIIARLRADKASMTWMAYVPAPHKWLCDTPWDGWDLLQQLTDNAAATDPILDEVIM